MDNAIKTFTFQILVDSLLILPVISSVWLCEGGGRLLFSNLWSHFPEPPVEGPSGPALLPKAPKARKYCFTVESGKPSPLTPKVG